MSVARGLTFGALGVVAVALVAGYNPARVASIAPPAAPLAFALHDLLAGGSAPVAASAPAPVRPPVSVVTAAAQRKSVPWTIDEIGTAQTIATVSLRTHFDATVEKVLVADGAEVKAGDVLIKLDPRQVEAQLDGARAQLAKDVAQLEQNDRDVVRYTDLVSRNATPIRIRTGLSCAATLKM